MKNHCMATQNFFHDNEWYTNIFYKSPDTIQNSINYPCFDDRVKQPIHIVNQTGICIPVMSLSVSDDTKLDAMVNSANQTGNFIYKNKIKIDVITPIPSNMYSTCIITNPNSLPIYGKFDAKYKIYNVTHEWTPTTTQESISFRYTTIKGKYMGMGGYIQQKYATSDTIINSPNGFKILDVLQDENNKNMKLVLDIGRRELNADINAVNIGYKGIIYQKTIDRPLTLKGENYIYMSSPVLDSIVTTSSNKVTSAFAKILLTGAPGRILYNTFVANAKIFTEGPLPELNELEIKLVTNDNKLFEFHGHEHSFSLEILELVDSLSAIASRTGNVS